MRIVAGIFVAGAVGVWWWPLSKPAQTFLLVFMAVVLVALGSALRRADVPVPEFPFPVRGGCGQNGDGSWATDGHGCPVCGAYGAGGDHGWGIAGSDGCPNRAKTYDYDGNVLG